MNLPPELVAVMAITGPACLFALILITVTDAVKRQVEGRRVSALIHAILAGLMITLAPFIFLTTLADAMVGAALSVGVTLVCLIALVTYGLTDAFVGLRTAAREGRDGRRTRRASRGEKRRPRTAHGDDTPPIREIIEWEDDE